MKKIILLTCMLFIGFCTLAEKHKPKSLVHIVSTRMNVFYFKVEKECLGAELEIFSQDGVKLFAQTLDHRKILIDFHYKNPGTYVVIIKKGSFHEEFNFVKDEPCLDTEKPTQSITVVHGITSFTI